MYSILPSHPFFSGKEAEIFLSRFIQFPSAFSSLNKKIQVIKIFLMHFKQSMLLLEAGLSL